MPDLSASILLRAAVIATSRGFDQVFVHFFGLLQLGAVFVELALNGLEAKRVLRGASRLPARRLAVALARRSFCSFSS